MRTYGRFFTRGVRSWDLCSSETGDDPVVHEGGVACPIPAEEEQFVRRTIQRHFGREAARGILLSLKEGLTNDSFLFSACGKKYIFRRNGKGTEHLIDRENELRVYEALRSTGITERVVALSIEPGYKISRYYEGSHVCNPGNRDEVRACMKALREFHARGLRVEKRFDPFASICHYEGILLGGGSVHPEHTEVREAVFSLQPFLAPFLEKGHTLCHIDSISDNFLFVEGRESPYLIDWEYAGCSDPLVDIAMFAIYANYTEEETDRLIAAYFPEGFDNEIRVRVYAYMAVGGFLWSAWCSYKSSLGVHFGVYAENQFRYAKTYPAKVRNLLEKL